MRVTDFCPSPHLEALDCGDRIGDELVVTIKGAERKTVGSEKVVKGVIFFEELERGLVLNKTNSRTIAEMYGSDTDAWMGKKITIYRSETSFQGKVVPCIRVRENGHKKSK
jgi:hypothetical protein